MTKPGPRLNLDINCIRLNQGLNQNLNQDQIQTKHLINHNRVVCSSLGLVGGV